jgi:hypothetical protein
MNERVFYAWQDKGTGKWHLSAVRKGLAWRPSNQYDTRGELLTAAGARGTKVEWEDD